MKYRKKVWDLVEVTQEEDLPGRIVNLSILSLILLNVLAIILESVESFRVAWSGFFRGFEVFSVAVFSVEYLARIWSCVEISRYRRPIRGRLRFAFKFMSLVDLVSVLPFYLPFLGLDLRFIRVLRIMRVFRILKVARYFESLKSLKNVFHAKRHELLLTTGFMFLLLVISSCLMYCFESAAQPDKFSSIPETMWWAIATLTTVGYGDVYPVTIAGKIFAGIISILGIGMFALPTGIIGSGFIEEIQKKKSFVPCICPHCGKNIEKKPDELRSQQDVS
jgi:voltage-gated potassium channel